MAADISDMAAGMRATLDRQRVILLLADFLTLPFDAIACGERLICCCATRTTS